MYYKKLLILTLILNLLSFMMIFPLGGGCFSQFTHNQSKAVAGFLNLTKWQPQGEVIGLDGQWEFYWNQLLEPAELKKNDKPRNGYINLPGSWNGYVINDNGLPGDGYATYRLLFKTEESGRLGIKIPRIFTAYKLWANEELIASAGIVGKSRETMIPQYLPQVAFFQAQQGENEIVIQVSNFYHRSGGVLESLILGNEKQILDLRYRRIAYELFLFGSLMIIGIYHFALFFF